MSHQTAEGPPEDKKVGLLFLPLLPGLFGSFIGGGGGGEESIFESLDLGSRKLDKKGNEYG